MSQISQFLMDEPLEEEDSVTSVSLRQAFVCSEGCLILAADYSQLELRILAHMSQDAKLMQILGPQNPDVFRAMAAKWKKKYLPEVTDTDRLVILVLNFTMMARVWESFRRIAHMVTALCALHIGYIRYENLNFEVCFWHPNEHLSLWRAYLIISKSIGCNSCKRYRLKNL